MGPLFRVDTYWYRQEFAKSRRMSHLHGLCWRSHKQPHNLIHWCYCQWPLWWAGKDELGNPNKKLCPPPDGSALPPSEKDNPVYKLLMDVSQTQETLLEDHLMLSNHFNLHRCSNRFNLHRCSDYSLRSSKSNSTSNMKKCRMEFPKPTRSSPAIVKDQNDSLRLEMERDHSALVQRSKFHTQGWRANGDISLILPKFVLPIHRLMISLQPKNISQVKAMSQLVPFLIFLLIWWTVLMIPLVNLQVLSLLNF